MQKLSLLMSTGSREEEALERPGASVKEEDLIQNLYVLSSHSQLLCFTTKGKVFWLKVYEIPVASRTSKG
jgi:DNA gyrase subunit A